MVGCRGAADEALFAEQYLDEAAEEAVGRQLGLEVSREYLVEVGNLSLAYPGQARAVIAATTAFLAAAGYRWVIFTAARPLFNAFRRLGLRPIPLACADPERLSGGSDSWGCYYDGKPHVYAGDIQAGLAKLTGAAGSSRTHLRDLLAQSRAAGGERPDGPARSREGVFMKAVLDRLHDYARRTPQALAVSDEQGAFTYGEFAVEVDAAAVALRAKRLGILADNSCAWAAVDLAAALNRTVCVPLPTFFSDAQLAHIVADAGLDLVVTDQPGRLRSVVGAEPDETIARPDTCFMYSGFVRPRPHRCPRTPRR